MKAEKFLWISDGEYYYLTGYYTMNKWIDNDTVVITRSKNKKIGVNSPKDVCELVKVNLKDNSMRVLCDDVLDFAQHVVHENNVYYSTGKELKGIDVKSGKTEVLYRNEFYADDENAVMESPHKTADGRFISLYVSCKGKASVFITVDTVTGKMKKICEKKFENPFPMTNHGMVCPTDKDLMFFSHEGITFYVSNRLWLADARNGKMWNIAKQRLNDDGNLGDCFGHEMWAPDGKGLYFVKYKCSPTPPRGICYVDVQTGKAKLLYSGFGYWHVGVSADGKYLTSDTQTGKDYSEVVVIDIKTGEEVLIDEAKTDWNHPCHPHPQLSFDNNKLMYTAIDESGRTGVKIAILK